MNIQTRDRANRDQTSSDQQGATLLYGKDMLNLDLYAGSSLLDSAVNTSESLRLPRFRAQRFGLQLPLRCRARGETAWWNGRTWNISYTGVFFWAEQIIEVSTEVDLSLEIPLDSSRNGAVIVCRAEIVRTAPPASFDNRPSLAARILAYRIVNGRKSHL